MTTLILYDLLILRRSAVAAFARKRDIVLLLVAAPIGLLMMIERGGKMVDSLSGLPVTLIMLIAAAVALVVNLAVASRLAHLREESIVARQALRPAAALLHGLFWNLPPLACGFVIVLGSAGRAVVAPTLVLAYLAGIAVAVGQRFVRRAMLGWVARRRDAGSSRKRELRGDQRRQRLIELLAGRTGLFGPAVAANLLGFAVIGAVSAAVHFWLSSYLTAPAAAVIAGLPVMLLLIVLLMRTPPSLHRYLLYLGDEPIVAALVASALAAALISGVVVVTFAAGAASPVTLFAGAAMALLLFLSLALLRTLHFATKPRQAAEIAMQLDLVAIGLAGLVALPLAPVLVVLRLWMLGRRARAMRYLAT